jgi:hypothetical protein
LGELIRNLYQQWGVICIELFRSNTPKSLCCKEFSQLVPLSGLKALYIKTAQKLKGSDRRQFMAEVVRSLGIGGQTFAERELGWNRRTIRKGMGELTSGQALEDGYHRSGRKRVEEKLPNLLEDIRALVEPQAQTDPSFKSTRL